MEKHDLTQWGSRVLNHLWRWTTPLTVELFTTIIQHMTVPRRLMSYCLCSYCVARMGRTQTPLCGVLFFIILLVAKLFLLILDSRKKASPVQDVCTILREISKWRTIHAIFVKINLFFFCPFGLPCLGFKNIVLRSKFSHTFSKWIYFWNTSRSTTFA